MAQIEFVVAEVKQDFTLFGRGGKVTMKQGEIRELNSKIPHSPYLKYWVDAKATKRLWCLDCDEFAVINLNGSTKEETKAPTDPETTDNLEWEKADDTGEDTGENQGTEDLANLTSKELSDKLTELWVEFNPKATRREKVELYKKAIQ